MKQRIYIAAIFIAIMLGGAAKVQAQPVLNFTRIVNNWPTIEIYFKVACNGQPAYPTAKQLYTVYENNIPVDNFTLWCPDPRQRCAISVSLVLDASGSMSGAGNASAKAAGNAFVDLMDGIIDEAAVIWFNSLVNVELGMTTNKTDLHDAINALPANGGSAVWDGIYVGLQELILSGSNPCRAIIAMSDGADGSSSHTVDEIIALANRNRIRVFTIGIGSVSPTELSSIATLTGGKYYHAPSQSQLVTIYEEISTIIFHGFLECLITYEPTCKDGGLRLVDLQLDYCNGSDMKTRTYNAPKDTSTYLPLHIEIGDTVALSNQSVSVPVQLLSPLPGPQNWYPADFSIEFDTSTLVFDKVTAPPGSILEGMSLNVSQTGNIISIESPERVTVDNNQRICDLHFRTLQIQDVVTSTVRIASWIFQQGCFRPVPEDGSITVFGGDKLVILPSDTVRLCEGESLVLTAQDGFTDYIWSTGATGRTLTVDQPGSYWVSAVLLNSRDTSDAVTIVQIPSPVPDITPSRDTTICGGESLVLSAEGGFAEYQWSTGETGESIAVDTSGTYHVQVRDVHGCMGVSSSINVNIVPKPAPVISGRAVLCGTDPVYTYNTAPLSERENEWMVENGTIVGDNSGDSVTVQWNPNVTAMGLILRQTDPEYGCIGYDTLEVFRQSIEQQLSISGDTTICRGTKLTLSVTPGYDSYLWSTGETGSSIKVEDEGDYYVEMVLDQCTAVSDTIHVTVLEDIPITVSGPAVMCQNNEGQFRSTSYPGARYFWDVYGGIVVNGQESDSASIRFESPGIYRVIIMASLGSCFDEDTLEVTVEPAEIPAVAVTDTSLCEGETAELTATDGVVAYAWSTGATTRGITVGQTGDYTVTVEYANGCTVASMPIHISVYPLPPKPVIQQTGNLLTCTVSAARYIWYLDGTEIPGESGPTIMITKEGSYSVRVITAQGCEALSDPMTFTSIGTYAPTLASSFSIAPNPSSGVFEVAIEFEQPTEWSMRIVNVTGQTVYTESVQGRQTSFRRSISLTGASPGVYFFLLESGSGWDTRKIVLK